MRTGSRTVGIDSPSRDRAVPSIALSRTCGSRNTSSTELIGPAGTPIALSLCTSVSRVQLQASRLDHCHHLLAIAHPVCVGPGERLIRQSRDAQYLDEQPELRITANGNHQLAIGYPKHLVGNEIRVCIAHAVRSGTGHEEVHRLVREDRHLRVEQCHVDGRALASPATLQQRRLYGRNRIEPGKDVGVGHAGLLSASVRLRP